MSNELINPKPCDCDERNDSTEIRIQHMWRGHREDVAIIYCSKCQKVESVNVPRYLARENSEFSQLMYKAWNNRKSPDHFNRAIELLEACSEDLFITGTDKELERHIDIFLNEVKQS